LLVPVLISVLIPHEKTDPDPDEPEPWSFHNLRLFSGIDPGVMKERVVPFISLNHSISGVLL
jgi:hypothetical protein